MSTSLVDKIKNKLDFSKRNNTTMTGEPADEIIVHGASGVNKVVKEEKEKHAVFTFGRFNPPTTGHQKLIDAVKSTAEKHGGEHHIFASHSQDKAKNPLGYDEKVGFMKKMYPKTNIHSSHSVKNVLDAAKSLQARGVTHGTLVVGSDRVDEFHNLLSKYNKHPSDPAYDPKKHFHIPHLSVVSAGQRDPDAEGVEGMSASKMRGHATSGNFKEFSKGVSNPSQAKPMYDTLRARMGIKEEMTLEQIIRGRLDPDASDFQKQLDMKKKKTVQASNKEDKEGASIAKRYKTTDTRLPSDMTDHPYEETRHVIPMDRDTGDKPVDIGIDKDLEAKDTSKQLKRRKAMKLFRSFVEGSDGDAYGEQKPSAFAGSQLSTPVVSTPLQSVKASKQKIKTEHVNCGTPDCCGQCNEEKEDNETPFSGPYRPITNKDRFGNTIKPKNQAARLAKQGMKSVKTEEADDESGMAKNQLDTVVRSAKELKSKIKDKKELPAWVQAKITKGEDQIDTVADYMKSESRTMSFRKWRTKV
jgi:hypothetical protein